MRFKVQGSKDIGINPTAARKAHSHCGRIGLGLKAEIQSLD